MPQAGGKSNHYQLELGLQDFKEISNCSWYRNCDMNCDIRENSHLIIIHIFTKNIKWLRRNFCRDLRALKNLFHFFPPNSVLFFPKFLFIFHFNFSVFFYLFFTFYLYLKWMEKCQQPYKLYQYIYWCNTTLHCFIKCFKSEINHCKQKICQFLQNFNK